MFDKDLFLDFFIALFALLNPLYAIPVFLGLAAELGPRERQRTAAIAALTALIALAVAALVGDQLLALFGVHVESFQIAGGLIVLMIALNMMKDDDHKEEEAKEAIEREAAASRKNIAVYPLAIPLLAGPGVFVTTIVFSSRLSNSSDFVALGAAILAIVVLLWLAMAFATTAARFLNQVAITIGTKILGILLAAVSVEMMINGIDAHFLARSSGG
ncbi:MAG: MarC family protein [Kiloniellales bacterium]|jgi:multiple antibiotic resistance protein|nr:MarC family protein [Kiloniellales bacterium]